jgi:hypothetical protein
MPLTATPMMTPVSAREAGRSVIVPDGRPSPSASGVCVIGIKIVLPFASIDVEVRTGAGAGVVFGGATGVKTTAEVVVSPTDVVLEAGRAVVETEVIADVAPDVAADVVVESPPVRVGPTSPPPPLVELGLTKVVVMVSTIVVVM